MKTTGFIPLIALALLGLFASNCLFVVREIDRAVLLTFGEVTNSDIDRKPSSAGMDGARISDNHNDVVAVERCSQRDVRRHSTHHDDRCMW